MLDAEVVVSALVLPELLQGLSLELGELERLLLDGHRVSEQLIKHLSLKTEVRNGNLATVVVATSVRHLESELGVFLPNCLLDLLPVDLELFSFFDLLHVKLHNETVKGHNKLACLRQQNCASELESEMYLRIVKVFLNENDLAICVKLVLFHGRSSTTSLLSSLGVSLAIIVLLWEGLVASAADLGLVLVDFELS